MAYSASKWREYFNRIIWDNVVTDAMIEGAERCELRRYNWYTLPIARIVKAYSEALNLFGIVGPIPEGMAASSALKHDYYTTRHKAAVAAVQKSTEQFRIEHGFEPPVWEILRMARKALKAS
jgi:hypothetical protein